MRWRVVALAVLVPALAPAATLRVPSEYATIQAGVDAAAAGDTVLVAPGTYTDVVTRTTYIGGVGPITVTSALILKDGVAVVSKAGPTSTIIDTSGQPITGVGWAVVGGVLTRRDNVLSGFEIKSPSGFNAIHVQTSPGAALLVKQCRFVGLGNYQFDASGAISSSDIDLTVDDCEFEGCTGVQGGAVSSFGCVSLTISRSRFVGCSAAHDGGAVYVFEDECFGGSVDIEDCVFEDNSSLSQGGGVLISDNGGFSYKRIEGCTFQGNTATFGGGGVWIYQTGGNPSVSTVVRGSVFLSNRYTGGSTGTGVAGLGTSCSLGSFDVIGNTFAGNTGSSVPGGWPAALGVSPGNCVFVVQDNVFAYSGPTGAMGYVPGGPSSFATSCNLFWQNEGGNAVNVLLSPTDVELDPLFCDWTQGDVSVASNSPCLVGGVAGCSQIGALGQGCGPISLDDASWGAIKGRYR